MTDNILYFPIIPIICFSITFHAQYMGSIMVLHSHFNDLIWLILLQLPAPPPPPYLQSRVCTEDIQCRTDVTSSVSCINSSAYIRPSLLRHQTTSPVLHSCTPPLLHSFPPPPLPSSHPLGPLQGSDLSVVPNAADWLYCSGTARTHKHTLSHTRSHKSSSWWLSQYLSLYVFVYVGVFVCVVNYALQGCGWWFQW